MPLSRRSFISRVATGALAAGFSPLLRAQTLGSGALPRSTPEAEGIDSAGILAFIDAMAAAGHEMHSFMLLRHGRVAAEGWWDPYGAAFPHTLYSLSKSFTSTAVGFAREEGKLRLSDPVIGYFPDDLPPKLSDHLAALKIENLLTMSVGHDKEPTDKFSHADNWAKVFLAHPIVYPPGTHFLYNSASTYMLSAIVQKVTGQRVVDYLEPRLFAPLGIAQPTWETSPSGVNTGGWGLSLPTEALARFGQTLLRKGQWDGRQVIPASWVADATAFHIQQPGENRDGRPKQDSDWLQGYGYQFWRCRHGAFRGDGALGQYIVVFPEQDAVFVMTGESAQLQGELDLVWKHLLPALQPVLLPASLAGKTLRERLPRLALMPPPASTVKPAFSPGRYRLEANSLGLTELEFSWHKGGAQLAFKQDGVSSAHTIEVGHGRWRKGSTELPGVPPRQILAGMPPAGTKYRIAAAGRWTDASTYEMVWRYYETPQYDTIVCRFAADTLSIKFAPSLGRNHNERPEELTGRS